MIYHENVCDTLLLFNYKVSYLIVFALFRTCFI